MARKLKKTPQKATNAQKGFVENLLKHFYLKKCLFTQGNLKIAWYIFSLSILWLYFPLVKMIQATLSLDSTAVFSNPLHTPIKFEICGWLFVGSKKCYLLSSSCQESIHFWDSHSVSVSFCMFFMSLYIK